MASITDVLPLPNTTVTIPRLGFGVYRSPQDQTVKSCLAAIQAGYRHIDTAQFYGNEAQVGDVVRTCGLDRKDLFTTTKILTPAGSPEATYEKILESVRKIGGGGGEGAYVDLFLIHSASCGKAGRKESWLALERLLAEGKTRAIGVSNYGISHLEEMREYAKIWPPHVNQIEVSEARQSGRYQGVHWLTKNFCTIYRFTHGVSSGRPSSTASPTGSSSKRTVPSLETIKRTNRRLFRLLKNMAKLPPRSWLDGRYRRASSRCQRATTQTASRIMLKYMGSKLLIRIWPPSTPWIRRRKGPLCSGLTRSKGRVPDTKYNRNRLFCS